MKKITILLLFVLGSWQLYAQSKITGVVRDEQGLEIIGATIIQKGTSNGTTTNIDGKFSLSLVEDEEKAIVVSMIGYTKKVIEIKNQSFLNILLAEDAAMLEEVVVVGYGTQKKVSLTGSISNVGNSDLKSTPVSSITNALTGRIPGLVTRQESGRPGGDNAALFIRGRASLNDSSPLVLVDGVERPMAQVDPDDIETISILKDASATAVYGVRGANGVILVTTKRGREGETKISFSSEFGITSFNRITETLNAEYVSRFMREGLINDGFDPTNAGNSRKIQLSEYDNYLYRTQKSPFTHPDNNFVEMFTKNGFQQKYNVNLSGGNKNVRYFVSVGYFTQTGMFETDVNKIKEHETIQTLLAVSPNAAKGLYEEAYDSEYSYSRLTTRSNIDINLNEDFSVAINLAYRFGNQNRPRGYDAGGDDVEGMRLFGMFYRNAPQAFPILNPNGSYAATDGVWRQNPLVTLCYTGFRKNYNNKLESDFSFKYNLKKLLKGLSVDGRFSYDVGWSNWREINQRPNIYRYNQNSNTYQQGLDLILPTKGSGKNAATHRKYGELAIRYKQSFSGHNLSGLVLYNINSTSIPGGRYSYIPHIYQAFVGRLNYDYKQRYLFEVNAGYNGSNRFAEGHRYQLFPATSIGWILTNEPYFKKNDILTFTKLRFSYGEVGNDNLGGFSYYYRSGYDGGWSYSFGETHNPNVAGLIQGKSVNEDITWESAKKYNIGFDTQWFNNSMSINVDFFKERRSNILCEPTRFSLAAGPNGLAPMNYGIVVNKGYEIEIGYRNQIMDFNYFIKGIYAYAHNEIIEKSESVKPYSYMTQTGNPIGQFIGYHSDGFFDSYEEVASSPLQFGQASRPGDIKYKDLNQDGIINSDDQAPIGFNGVPEISYSLSAGFTWNNFDFSVLFQGAARTSIYLKGDIAWDNVWGNYYEEHINRWTPETAETATYPRFGKAATETHPNYYLSDFWVKDASYIRLKNIQIGYTIPRKWLKQAGINSLRVYANAYNLFTWDNVNKVDPESASNSIGYFYPQQKVINFGVNLIF